MAQTGDDCYFFYYQSCIKGAACPFRHVEEALANEATCDDWRRNQCHTVPCHFRHMELQKSTPCYYERQPGGCTKPNCLFQHKFSGKSRPLPSSTTSSIVTPGTVPTSISAQTMAPHPSNTGTGPTTWNPPPPVWPGAHIPPPPQMYQRPPGPLGPGFPPFQPPVVPMSKPTFFPPPIDPVIINPNEESSDQDSIKGSPMKPVSRKVVPTSDSTMSSNPLDYFLNAKPWVDPKQPRSLSPDRISPYRKQGSASPRRSVSPDNIMRRRSVSAERYGNNTRRRSGSLDRSKSPDWRDRRRFGRRSSRSPPRRRSRSPGRDGRGRDRGLMNKFKQGPRTGQKLEEVKVTGSKIISIKKDDGGKDKIEESYEDKSKVKESESSAPEDEVKSLEEIYRERALMSLMEAKRKKILENKRKRWEKVEPARKSESDKSDKQSSVDEKGDNPDHTHESSSETNEDEVNSEVDLADDIDIELGEGELESDSEGKIKSDHELENEIDKTERRSGSSRVRSDKSTRSQVSIPNKSKLSIKSRLGLKAVNDIKEQAEVKQPERNINRRSVKDRLGLKSSVASDVSERRGVVKLNRSSKAEDVLSRIRMNRTVGDRKNILMLPQITIKNEVDIEQRKAGIKRRLGLIDEDDMNVDSRRDRKKKSLDEELMKLLNEEGANIAEDDLDLLSKKEKKKLLKKLLVQQGREDEYESFRRKKKKGLKKRKEVVDEDEDKDTRRRIKLRDRSEEKDQSDDWEDTGDLPSEEEICLGEEVDTIEEQSTEENKEPETTETRTLTPQAIVIPDVRSQEEIHREKVEKEAKLREALEPKSLEDIRKERAVKRAQGGDVSTRLGGNKRKIVLDTEPVTKPADPAVRVTFNSEDLSTSRKLVRLGRLGEQNENDQPKQSTIGRASKQERKIYVPPTRKKLGETGTTSVAVKHIGPPKGREIVDYGDMFPQKSASADQVAEKRKAVKLTASASETDLAPQRRLGTQRPPKVEVKNAEVKTFAEIMAEKKRKRQLAQQGKTFTPLTLDESDSRPSIEKKTDSVDRLSPVLSSSVTKKPSTYSTVSSSVTNKPSTYSTVSSSVANKSSTYTIVSTSQKSFTLNKSASEANIEQTDTKPTRWKRRKLSNTDTTPTYSEPVTSISQESVDSVDSKFVAQTKTVPVSSPVVKSSSDTKAAQKTTVTPGTPLTVEKSLPEPVPKEKRKSYDSLLEFDDDLLDMDDDDLDLDLGDEQDHDALMKEMDELLS